LGWIYGWRQLSQKYETLSSNLSTAKNGTVIQVNEAGVQVVSRYRRQPVQRLREIRGMFCSGMMVCPLSLASGQ
jgi:hypothetical protein